MLYRPAPLARLRIHTAFAVHAVGAALAALASRRADRAYIAGLNDAGLRDLGLRRVETRGYQRFY